MKRRPIARILLILFLSTVADAAPPLEAGTSDSSTDATIDSPEDAPVDSPVTDSASDSADGT